MGYTLSPECICYPSSFQFVRHNIFFGFSQFLYTGVPKSSPLANGRRKKDGQVDPNTQDLDRFGGSAV
jgi:hypothetical protein